MKEPKGADSARDLEVLIRSRYPVVAVDTLEEDRLRELLGRVATRLDVPLYTWSRTQGLVREGNEQPVYDTADPFRMLAERVQALREWARGRAVPAA